MSDRGTRFERVPGTRVWIDLRATGLLRAVAHDPALWVEPDQVTVAFDAGPTSDADGDEARVEARFSASAVHVPEGMSRGDTEKMLENVRGRQVLDATRHPAITFHGVYRGNLDAGVLEGELTLRGAPRRLSIPVRLKQAGGAVGGAGSGGGAGDPAESDLQASGTWEGRLTDLGVKPFKALLGAIKLEDWVRLRLEARFRRSP